MNTITRYTALGAAALSVAGLASAQEVTGAGASFPAPLYSCLLYTSDAADE